MVSPLNIGSSQLGTSLQTLLMADDILPGSEPSYQVCKTIYLYHPLGAKMAESPITMAQSQQREISIPNSPEDRVRKQFLDEWAAIGADANIHNTMKTARMYGVSSIALLVEGTAVNLPVDYKTLYNKRISFNVLDPLNTSGSLVLNQDPNAFDFQKHVAIAVSGLPYHPSRAVVVLNEKPVYLGYTNSAFGYVGRSVYQRALYPLKSFVQTLVTDDMVTRKAGVLIAVLKAAGSIVDNIMSMMTAVKRNIIKEAETNNVISINAPDESIETLNMQNLDGAYGMARKNILENIAVAADMPAKLLNSETFAEGFGEGTEDAKAVARYVDRVRVEMSPLYAFFDQIVQRRAWTPEFYAIIQKEFPETYGSMDFNTAFYQWSNSFTAVWPNLLTEPDSEKAKTEKVKLEAVVDTLNSLLPVLDPENKAKAIQWAAENMNTNKLMFEEPLILDYEALAQYVPPVPGMGDEDEDEGPPSKQDSNGRRVLRLPQLSRRAT